MLLIYRILIAALFLTHPIYLGLRLMNLIFVITIN